MKRKLLAMVCAVSMIASLGAATVYASDDVKATGDEKIALITMDSIDQHWITLNEGAQEEAKELGVKTIHALSLPGKVAPKSAGEIIESTILSILKEDDG